MDRAVLSSNRERQMTNTTKIGAFEITAHESGNGFLVTGPNTAPTWQATIEEATEYAKMGDHNYKWWLAQKAEFEKQQ